MSETGIEVFRDLTIASTQGEHSDIREFLLKHQTKDWVHAKKQEDQLRKYAASLGSEDVVVFAYEGTEFPSAGITLWQRNNGYSVTNIVPSEIRELDTKQYNDLLCSFVEQVLNKTGSKEVLKVHVTDAVRPLNSWTSEGASEALRRFSVLANKSTTNSHPCDAERWEEFVILAHQSRDKLPVDVLIQWLTDVDGWDDTSANKLAINFESGISLLEAYDAFSKD